MNPLAPVINIFMFVKFGCKGTYFIEHKETKERRIKLKEEKSLCLCVFVFYFFITLQKQKTVSLWERRKVENV